MKQISHATDAPYSAKQIYDLVNDVDAYPEFVPNCVDSGIEDLHDNKMIAYIEIEKLGVRKRLETKNILTPPSKIVMHLIEGPVSHLQGEWTFEAIDEHSCTITFNLEIDFNNKFAELAFGSMFEDLVVDLVEAFNQRAQSIYGPPK